MSPHPWLTSRAHPCVKLHQPAAYSDDAILDPSTLPAYPSLETIKREALLFFSFEGGAQRQRFAKVDDETPPSHRKRKPQDQGFWTNGLNRHLGITHWDTVKLCCGQGEDRSHLHRSIRVHRLIVKTTWAKFKYIAERQDRYLLDKVLNLRVLIFGHMILLQFAFRLRSDHDRMGAVLQFIYDMR
ncbi:hypothetical protein AAVH_08835 [Aphelenchoides avenae]|nr:hypothetical protein AAVH_08833 [Aphelenchus avenae]KAH7723729.1 hypothetical protein AAVH_08835 [Aphelenchus avenae]